MNRSLAALAILAFLPGCSTADGSFPSLAPRSAETIDPRLPVADPAVIGAPSAELSAQLAALVAQAQAGDRAFRDTASLAERLTAAAGSPRSESWIAAQQAVSAAVAARQATTRALGDLDSLAAQKITRDGGIAPNDLAAIREAIAIVARLDRDQAAQISGWERRLGS